MGKFFGLLLSGLMIASPVATSKAAELQPVVSVNLFGGAERGNDEPAGGIGGGEILGMLPLADRLGLQGSLLNQGGNGGYRLGVTAGPVYAFDSGKVGLFGDYIHRGRDNTNFFYLRGEWSHYFDNFDLLLSYTQPVNSVQHTTRSISCFGSSFRVRAVQPAINELKALVRYYPSGKSEVNAGFLVNSFAGPHHDDPGTGFGGVFGFAYQVLDWLIVRPVQAQMDTRNRYRITSGVELVWSPLQQSERGSAGKSSTSFATPTGGNCAQFG
jgi:hypothetical protein